MDKGWYKFQENIKSIFIEMGCDAQSNVKLQGARTVHDIDVLIRSRYLGQPIQWIIEAKNWNKKVSKLHVLALRKIVEETGSDKGVLVSQKGFQSGAFEAAELSNIELLTFDELIELTKEVFHKDILKTYVRRMNYILNRYFAHSKSIRIEFGLRHETWDSNVDFSVYFMLVAIFRTVRKALDNKYPIKINIYQNEKFGNQVVNNFYQTINWLNLNLIIVEERILEAEVKMQKAEKFKPLLSNNDIDENFHIKAMEIFTAGSLGE